MQRKLVAAIRKIITSNEEFKGKTFEEYATKGSPFSLLAGKFSKYEINEHVYNAIKSKSSYQAMQKEISKAWKFHGKQKSTLHMIQSSRLGNLLAMLYASHPDAPSKAREEALQWAKSYRIA